MQSVTLDWMHRIYPGRQKWSHKGDHGRLLIIGGSRRYKGAPALCGLAALRTGVDLVMIAAPESASDVIAGFSPNLITEPLEGDYINLGNLQKVAALAHRFDAVLIGSGMGRMADTMDTLIELLFSLRKPCVLDADALHLIHDNLKLLKSGWVVTPHESEFYSMTHSKPGNSLEQRVKAVQRFSSQYKATVLLKGYKDVIGNSKQAFINSTGNPYMTVGGTGDVLAGICAGLLAMGMKPLDAAAGAAFICGEAGNLAAQDLGPGLLPTDVIDRIPGVIRMILD